MDDAYDGAADVGSEPDFDSDSDDSDDGDDANDDDKAEPKKLQHQIPKHLSSLD